MIVSDLGEMNLIERLKRRLGRTPLVVLGIGDDTAVLRRPTLPGVGASDTVLLLASDMVVEGVHFTRASVSPRAIGWKALAGNVSDVAAMGGRPCAAVVSLGLPRTIPVRFVEALYRGLSACARRFGLAIVGGDTVRAPCVIVDVAILGVADRRRLALRRGARIGDQLYVTGRLGNSLRSGRHARFLPRLREAVWLTRRGAVHAMIDVSDGLSSDLWQVARASRATLRVEAARIPTARGLTGRRGLHRALTDGEDFELLVAVPPREAKRLPRRIGRCPLTRIGSVVGRGARVELQEPDGTVRPLAPGGFRHF